MSMGSSGDGKDIPSTEGVEYEAGTVTNGEDPETVFSEVDSTDAVIVVADPGNGDNIYFGWDDQVDETTGVPLQAGQSVSFDLDVTEQNIYVMTDTGTQAYRYASLR